VVALRYQRFEVVSQRDEVHAQDVGAQQLERLAARVEVQRGNVLRGQRGVLLQHAELLRAQPRDNAGVHAEATSALLDCELHRHQEVPAHASCGIQVVGFHVAERG